MDQEPGVTGKLEIYDGRNLHSPHLITYDIINGTLPMGVTSTFYYMFVRFTWNIPRNHHCPSLPDCIKFTILVDSAPAPGFSRTFCVYMYQPEREMGEKEGERSLSRKSHRFVIDIFY